MQAARGQDAEGIFHHGPRQRDTASSERVGYNNVAAALQHQNFLVETINFTQQADVPSDATLVIVSRVRVPISFPPRFRR